MEKMKGVTNIVVWVVIVILTGYISWRISDERTRARPPLLSVNKKRSLSMAMMNWRSLTDENMYTREYSVEEDGAVRLIVYQDLPPEELTNSYLNEKEERLYVNREVIEIPSAGFIIIELKNARSAPLSGRKLLSVGDMTTKEYDAMIRRRLSVLEKSAFDVIKDKLKLVESLFKAGSES